MAASTAARRHSAGVSALLTRVQRDRRGVRMPPTLRLSRPSRNSDDSASAARPLGSAPMSIQALRARMAELSDLSALGRLAAWDQRTMMPPAGGAGRGEQLATLERLAHERATADEVGEWLEALEAAELEGVDAEIVRLARRDFDRAQRVPGDLAAELERASSEGQTVSQAARAANDFAALAPALRRNVELAREYAACFDDAARPYDALLADYDFGLTAARLQDVFGELAEQLAPLVAEAPAGPPPVGAPVAAQRAAVPAVLARLGVGEDGWRID